MRVHPIAVLDSEGRLVRLHIAPPDARCNIPSSEREERDWSWDEAIEALIAEVDFDAQELLAPLLCDYCFGKDSDAVGD